MKDVLFIVGLLLMTIGGCQLSVPWTMIGIGALFVVFSITAHFLGQRPPRL